MPTPSISIFAWDAISTKNRSDSQIQVNNVSQIAVEEIEKAVRNASDISSPATKGASSNSLGLSYLDGSTKTFSVVSGRIQLSTAGNNYFITPDIVVIDEMTFLNLSRTGTPGVVQIKLRVSRKNIQNLTELRANTEITTSQSLRN